MQKANAFLTISEAAQLLKVSKTSLRRWSNDGRLPCYRVGYRRERRFLRNDLLAFVYNSEEPIDGLPETGTKDLGDSAGNRIEIRPPHHLCLMFRDEDEQWRKLRSYLLAHLKPGALTVYVYHGERPDVLDRLHEEGLDSGDLIEKGRLHVLACSESYLLGGYFDADRMLKLCADTIHRYSSAGIRKLLFTGEMEWCTSGLPGCGQLIHYEMALDDCLRNQPGVTLICQYSLVTIPATVIFDNLCLHPYVRLSDSVVAGLDFRSKV